MTSKVETENASIWTLIAFSVDSWKRIVLEML